MIALYISTAADGNEQVVRRPRPTDAVGSALRGAFSQGGALPADLARLLRMLER